MKADYKRITKNTLFLYLRMFFTLVIGLFSSRVILNVLGISDYGIYNVVGGIVTMLSFLNVGMVSSSQRFLSYSIGSGNINNLKTVFSTSVLIHFFISLIILLIVELLGVWFLNNHMNISADRLYAANYVLQFSIITFCISVNTVPYSSCIIAHEHMNVFAFTSVIESTLKLLIALFLLFFKNIDKLILFSGLHILIQTVLFLINYIYSRKHFGETHCKIHYDKKYFKEMFSFAGWGMLGNMGFSFKDQGSNIILNLFFNTAVNGARGIASQLNGIINGFASNFIMAINPQIIKLYAAGDVESSKQLVFSGARLTFYLLAIIVIPFLINSHYLVNLWLGNVPEYTLLFLNFIVIGSLIYSLSSTISTAILATGKVKWFQILLAATLLSELPMSYVILSLGGKLYMALIPSLVTIFCSLILRIVLLHKYVNAYKIKDYMLNVLLRCLVIFCICFGLSYYFRSLMQENFLTLVISTLISISVSLLLMFCFGITKKEQKLVLTKVHDIITNNLKKKNNEASSIK